MTTSSTFGQITKTTDRDSNGITWGKCQSKTTVWCVGTDDGKDCNRETFSRFRRKMDAECFSKFLLKCMWNGKGCPVDAFEMAMNNASRFDAKKNEWRNELLKVKKNYRGEI